MLSILPSSKQQPRFSNTEPNTSSDKDWLKCIFTSCPQPWQNHHLSLPIHIIVSPTESIDKPTSQNSSQHQWHICTHTATLHRSQTKWKHLPDKVSGNQNVHNDALLACGHALFQYQESPDFNKCQLVLSIQQFLWLTVPIVEIPGSTRLFLVLLNLF